MWSKAHIDPRKFMSANPRKMRGGCNGHDDYVSVTAIPKAGTYKINILHNLFFEWNLLLANTYHSRDLLPVYGPFLLASSTLFLKVDITWAGSAAPNTELPATIQFAPAEAAASMVEGPKPPSTCINKEVSNIISAYIHTTEVANPHGNNRALVHGYSCANWVVKSMKLYIELCSCFSNYLPVSWLMS